MTTKDYVYLSLLALSAVVFYWAGFYGGFNTTLKMLQHKEDENSSEDFEPKSDQLELASLSPIAPESRRATTPAPTTGAHFPIQDLSFGRN